MIERIICANLKSTDKSSGFVLFGSYSDIFVWFKLFIY